MSLRIIDYKARNLKAVTRGEEHIELFFYHDDKKKNDTVWLNKIRNAIGNFQGEKHIEYSLISKGHKTSPVWVKKSLEDFMSEITSEVLFADAIKMVIHEGLPYDNDSGDAAPRKIAVIKD